MGGFNLTYEEWWFPRRFMGQLSLNYHNLQFLLQVKNPLFSPIFAALDRHSFSESGPNKN